MNLLLIAEVLEGASPPAFGAEFEEHIKAKRDPAVRNASCTAWRLLALALERSGVKPLPQVRFEERGKPAFSNSPLHFSLSHSSNLAAALLSDSPCAVDVEEIRENVREKLMRRCMNDRERTLGCDFFECWTKKECLGKLSGRGISLRPAEMDSLDPEYTNHFNLFRCTDSLEHAYQLCALCMNQKELNIQKIGPEEL